MTKSPLVARRVVAREAHQRPSGVGKDRHPGQRRGAPGRGSGSCAVPSGDAQQGCPGAGAAGSAGPTASWERWAPQGPQRGEGSPKAWEDSHSAGAGAGVEAAAILGEWTGQAGQDAATERCASFSQRPLLRVGNESFTCFVKTSLGEPG